MASSKLLPLCGIAFVALVALTLGISGSTPEPGASAGEVVSHYTGNEAREFITSFLFAATVPFLVLFALGLTRSAPARDERSSLWGQVANAGAILAGGAILATAAIHFALLDAATQDAVASDAVLALNALDGATWVAFNAGFGVMMLGAAGLLIPSAGARRVLGWTALVLGVALFIPYADFFALMVMLVWFIVTGLVLRRGDIGPASSAQRIEPASAAVTNP